MDEWIDLRPYESIINSLNRGSTRRVNHDDCPAGQDRKRRLYITRLAGSGDMVVGYCHNCSNKGVFKNDGTWVPYRDFGTSPTQVQPTGTAFSVPMGLEFDPNLWPTQAHTWRIAKGLDMAQCICVGIAYDPSTNRVYLPQWDYLEECVVEPNSVLTGYQLRCLDGHGPKYLTAQKDKTVTMSTLMLSKAQRESDTMYTVGVIVEDLASGIIVSRALERKQYPALVTVNYGTRVSPEVLYLNKTFDFGVVWLDNDGPQIVRQAEKIAKVWAMLSGKPIQIERVYKDPKSVAVSDIIMTIDHHHSEAIYGQY